MRTEDVQILFADLQPTLVAGSRTTPPAELSLAASVLAKVAVALGLPMTFSIVTEGGSPGRLIPELAPFATDANSYRRGPPSPFLDLPTVSALAAHGRRTLVVAGFASEVVVLHAALDGLAADYDVQVPVDAVGDMSERTEAAAFRQIERAGGVTTSVWSLVSRLEPDFKSPPGLDAFELMRPLRPSPR